MVEYQATNHKAASSNHCRYDFFWQIWALFLHMKRWIWKAALHQNSFKTAWEYTLHQNCKKYTHNHACVKIHALHWRAWKYTHYLVGGHINWPTPRVENWPTPRYENWPTPGLKIGLQFFWGMKIGLQKTWSWPTKTWDWPTTIFV